MYGLSSLMKLLRLFLFSILSLQFSFVFGQPSTGSDEEVVAQIAVYIWAKGSYGDLLDRDGNLIYKYTPPEVKMAGPNGEVIDLMVFPNRRTPFVKYQGAPNLQFFKEIKVEGQADVQRQVIGQVQLPVATQSALLLFYPRDQAMSSFNVYPLLNVSQSVPAGKALVFNTCPFNIAAQLGSSPVFQMKPQEQRLADIRPKDFFLQYQFWMPNKTEWRKAYSSKKAVDPESSLILILHPRMNGDGSMNPRLIDMLSLSAK